MSGRRIAIVGAGPAGLYAVQAALASPAIAAVDVFDQLPAPYGLVRYGVAADHAKTKSVVRVFQKLFADERVRFFGNVSLGANLHRADLRALYDAVIYSTGARHDRDLGIPGEGLPGSHGAAEFVSWYSAHPDAPARDLLAGATSAVVIGAGNVALDVVRILAKDAAELAVTDMPDDVVESLACSSLTDIHLLARRGPAQAKFTAVELRELGELQNADVIVDPADLELDGESAAAVEASTSAQRNLRLLSGFAEREPEGRPRRVHLHFWTSSIEVLGDAAVEAVTLEVDPPPGHPHHTPSPRTSKLAAQVVLRAIGYRAMPLPELPFDERRGVIPNADGRVLTADGQPLPGEYVAGWLKRGPSGVIGTNRSDALETTSALVADLATLPTRDTSSDAVAVLLRERGVRYVDWAGWQRLERYEAALGAVRGASAIKVSLRQTMLDVCHGVLV